MRPGRGESGTEVCELEQQDWSFPSTGRSRSHWEMRGRVLVHDLAMPLERGSRYILPSRGGFRDLAGNELVDFDDRCETKR